MEVAKTNSCRINVDEKIKYFFNKSLDKEKILKIMFKFLSIRDISGIRGTCKIFNFCVEEEKKERLKNLNNIKKDFLVKKFFSTALKEKNEYKKLEIFENIFGMIFEYRYYKNAYIKNVANLFDEYEILKALYSLVIKKDLIDKHMKFFASETFNEICALIDDSKRPLINDFLKKDIVTKDNCKFFFKKTDCKKYEKIDLKQLLIKYFEEEIKELISKKNSKLTKEEVKVILENFKNEKQCLKEIVKKEKFLNIILSCFRIYGMEKDLTYENIDMNKIINTFKSYLKQFFIVNKEKRESKECEEVFFYVENLFNTSIEFDPNNIILKDKDFIKLIKLKFEVAESIFNQIYYNLNKKEMEEIFKNLVNKEIKEYFSSKCLEMSEVIAANKFCVNVRIKFF